MPTRTTQSVKTLEDSPSSRCAQKISAPSRRRNSKRIVRSQKIIKRKLSWLRSKFRPRGNRRFQPQGRRDDKSNKPFNQNHRRAYLLEQGKHRVKGAHATPGDRAPPVEVNRVDKISEQEANVAVRAGAVRAALRNRCMRQSQS